MFSVTGAEPVNDPRDLVALTREQLWDGLLLKAEDPVRFVPAITRCEVLERSPGGLVREVELRGERVRERVTFFPRERVLFERLSGSARGTIENVIEEGPDGRLSLRFTFGLEVEGVHPGSDEERAFADRMRASYLSAVKATLAEVRRRAGGTQLARE